MKEKLSNSQESQDNQELNSLIEIIDVEGTPFKIIENEKETMIVMGDQVIKNDLKNIEAAREYIKEDSWELRLTAGAIYNEYLNKIRKDEQ